MLKSYSVRGIIISLALFNELLMGYAFVLASGTPALPSGGSLVQNAVTSFATVTGSDWFIFTMALEMIFTIYMLRKNFQRNLVPIFALQAAVMFLAPTAIDDSSWHFTSIYLGSVAMIGLMILMLEHLYKQRMLDSPTRAYFLILMSLMAVMMAGLFLWVIQGNELIFIASILGEMILYFNAALAQSSFKRTPVPAHTKSWMSEPLWVFGIMLTMLVAEILHGRISRCPVLWDELCHGYLLCSSNWFNIYTGRRISLQLSFILHDDDRIIVVSHNDGCGDGHVGGLEDQICTRA